MNRLRNEGSYRGAEEIIGKLREAEVGLTPGQSVGQVARQLGVNDWTHRR